MPNRVPFLSSQVRGITNTLNRELRAIGGADSAEMKGAAKLLKASFRRVLNVRGRGRPSAPGEAPRRQSGQLARSVTDGVVGDARRVAVAWFTAPILEGGIYSTLPLRSGKSRRRKGGKATRALAIAARPFRQRAIDAVKDHMADVIARLGEDRLGKNL